MANSVASILPIILKDGIDNVGFPGLICSEDNGVTRILEYTASGKVYHQRDIDRISKIPFDKIKMRSPNKAVFSFAVDDEGIFKVTDSNGNVVSQTVSSTALSEMQSRISSLQGQITELKTNLTKVGDK